MRPRRIRQVDSEADSLRLDAQLNLDGAIVGIGAPVGHRADQLQISQGQVGRLVDTDVEVLEIEETPSLRPSGVSRWVDQRGSIGLNSFRYRVGPTFAGRCWLLSAD